MPDKFWIVWNEHPGGIPTHKHPTKDSAMMEAARLSRLYNNGGKQFHVMEVIASVKKVDVVWTDYGDINSDDIPF